MSEPSDPVPVPTPTPPGSLGERELDVDVTAFLPDPGPEPEGAPGAGVELASEGGEPVGEAPDPAQLSADLDRVDAALAALDAKTYGRHPETGELIDDALLAADPTRLS